MKRRFFCLVLLVTFVSACAEGEPAPPVQSPARPAATSPPTPAPSPSPTPSPSPARKVTLELWFAQDGRLLLTKRTERFQPAVARLAARTLLEGPTALERSAGADTAIPDGTVLRGIDLKDGIATVDLSRDISGTSGEEELRLAVAQIVYTVTQFKSVRAVRLEFEGRSIGSRELRRRTFASLLPAIVVESPAIGASVSSPVVVRGTANVFEATVSLRILDSRGTEIVRTFTTATCGTGCRGDYSESVRFSVSRKQRGTIEVFEESAETGRPINVVRIPVTLLP